MHFSMDWVKVCAQLCFRSEATTSLAKWNFPKHLSSCLCKNQPLGYIRLSEKSQFHWSHFSKANLLEVRSCSESASTLCLQSSDLLIGITTRLSV